jgi:hypothetical protein
MKPPEVDDPARMMTWQFLSKSGTVVILAPIDNGYAEPEMMTRDDKEFLSILVL